MTAQNLTKHSQSSYVGSGLAKSTPALMKAIHSPGDDAYILERVGTIINLYYNPGMSDTERFKIYDEYRKALRDLPKWAVAGAFDDWAKTGTHKPAPAHLRTLAESRIRILTDEIKRRDRAAQAAAEETRDRTDEERANGLRYLQQQGYTPKKFSAVADRPMAGNEGELFAERAVEQQPHWSEMVDPKGPEMELLRESRMENPIMRAALTANAAAKAASVEDEYTPPDWGDDE